MAHITVQALLRGGKRRPKRQRRLRPVRPSRANELWYKSELLRIVEQLRIATRETVFPELRPYVQAQETVGDALPSMSAAFERLAQRFGNIQGVAQRLAFLAVSRNVQSVDDGLAKSVKNALSVDIAPLLTQVGPIQTAITAATRANVDLITSLAPEHIEKVRIAIEKNFKAGMRWEDLAKSIEEVADVTESRAKLIARDQTGKMNGDFNKVRQTQLGIDSYVWQTSGDERVRPEHAEHDGKIFRWDDPPADTGHPGEDINCRCVAVPYFDLDSMERELGL